MSISTWQKSSYSGNASNCLELAEAADESVLLRESDEPSAVIVASRAVFGGLVRATRCDVIDS
ncbi:DUF397 domain-containing protein [Streptomyces paromomycinus]|uniref:DUF397 domain-containing protein n=1 Tax=Streptomyces paromomycinus TaxID=92743 RepID=A0A401W228_STREY|nr:DUF397 domain-containing protein [Streptomyces paromomycinus]GCD43341.1 hypothetical protein GKJPGBOP_03022 [Streptomyces paromomycinus]